jgi:hypothetical protein
VIIIYAYHFIVAGSILIAVNQRLSNVINCINGSSPILYKSNTMLGYYFWYFALFALLTSKASRLATTITYFSKTQKSPHISEGLFILLLLLPLKKNIYLW